MNRLKFLLYTQCCLNEWKYVFPQLALLGWEVSYKNNSTNSRLFQQLLAVYCLVGRVSQP